MKKGLFISVEGIDGAGKSSHVEFIQECLKERGFQTIITREPGGTELGERIRDLILHENMHRFTELLLLFASRQELIANVIIPNLEKGVYVIADRFVEASIAYQGAGRGLGVNKVIQLANMLEPNITTDLTFIFDAPLDVAMARVSKSRNKDRIESEARVFFQTVQNAYHDIAKSQPERVIIINTDQEKIKTRETILKSLDLKLTK